MKTKQQCHSIKFQLRKDFTGTLALADEVVSSFYDSSDVIRK